MRKNGIWLLVFLCIGMCSFPLLAQGKKENVVTLKMIAPWADKEFEGFKPVIEKFELENPGIKIEYRTGKPEDVATILSTQFSVGKTPADIIDTAWPWYIVQEAQKGNLLAIDDVVNPADFREGSLDQLMVDGKTYGVTSVGGLTIPEFNASLYRDNNLTDPRDVKSLDELLALMNQVQALPGVKAAVGTGGGVGWTNTSVIETWIVAFGGREMYMNLIAGKQAWNSKEVKQVLSTYLLPWLEAGLFGEPEEVSIVTENMWRNQYGFFVGGTTDSLRFNNPPGDYAIFALPGQKDVVMWSDYWFIPAYTEHPEEAKKLLAFLSTEGQAIQVKGGGRIATNLNVPLENYPPQEQMIMKVVGNYGIVPDMDDTIGGKFQTVMWDQLKLLWSDPSMRILDSVLNAIESAAIETRASSK
ncbi:MAG: extracellular solute-binding protein [Sphaerochaeta sp.]|nr:extracellular solute-binding protein [Sphaerochaeta sp.]